MKKRFKRKEEKKKKKKEKENTDLQISIPISRTREGNCLEMLAIAFSLEILDANGRAKAVITLTQLGVLAMDSASNTIEDVSAIFPLSIRPF